VVWPWPAHRGDAKAEARPLTELAACGHPGTMAQSRVIVYPPLVTGGRRVRFGDQILGTAYSLTDLAVLLRHAGLDDVDALDVAESDVIEWHEGGPEVWKR
jgi:hypothetical protein